MVCNLLIQHRSIYFHIDFFLHHRSKFRFANQCYNNLCYRIVQQFLTNLLPVIAFVPPCHGTMFAAIVIKILVFCTILFMLDTFVSIHPCATNGTLHNSRKQVGSGILSLVHMLVLFRLSKQLDLCGLPDFFRNNSFMQAIHQQIIVLFNKVVVISGSMNLFCFSAAISNLSTIYRIF